MQVLLEFTVYTLSTKESWSSLAQPVYILIDVVNLDTTFILVTS